MESSPVAAFGEQNPPGPLLKAELDHQRRPPYARKPPGDDPRVMSVKGPQPDSGRRHFISLSWPLCPTTPKWVKNSNCILMDLYSDNSISAEVRNVYQCAGLMNKTQKS